MLWHDLLVAVAAARKLSLLAKVLVLRPVEIGEVFGHWCIAEINSSAMVVRRMLSSKRICSNDNEAVNVVRQELSRIRFVG